MSTIINRIPMFFRENYDNWKLRMQAYLAALDNDIWYVITDDPIKIMKASSTTTPDGTPEMKEKPWSEWKAEDNRKNNLDNMEKDILYKTLDDNMFNKITTCTFAKEI
ncbi:uncharacterized protein LOC124943438 [Impatiens glandulifera]|uniref:uncharacterized protein LOC124943438 n=1 Tax=Impatiens glandulifera TaxID=253017 RepID=UPI001FB0C3AF|nr:uncharacterized protein LOC124943438 [Impatiens glandulifera]